MGLSSQQADLQKEYSDALQEYQQAEGAEKAKLEQKLNGIKDKILNQRHTDHKETEAGQPKKEALPYNAQAESGGIYKISPEERAEAEKRKNEDEYELFTRGSHVAFPEEGDPDRAMTADIARIQKELINKPIKSPKDALNVAQLEVLTGQKVPIGTDGLKDFLKTNKQQQPLVFTALAFNDQGNHYKSMMLQGNVLTVMDSNGELLGKEEREAVTAALGKNVKVQYVGKDRQLLAEGMATRHNVFDPQFQGGTAGTEYECACGLFAAEQVAALYLLADGKTKAFSKGLENLYNTKPNHLREKHSDLLKDRMRVDPEYLGTYHGLAREEGKKLIGLGKEAAKDSFVEKVTEQDPMAHVMPGKIRGKL